MRTVLRASQDGDIAKDPTWDLSPPLFDLLGEM